MNSILEEDFRSVYRDLRSDLESMRGGRILISGANGMIANYVLSFFRYLNEQHDFRIEVDGLVREIKRPNSGGIRYLQGDVCNFNFNHFNYDRIVHAASLASPIHYGNNPIGVSLPNIEGTINLLKLAEKCPLKSFLFVSSGEVYGQFHSDPGPLTETTLGWVDPMNSRSCYAESKRMGENFCTSWFHQKKVPATVIRPFHSYGPGLQKNDGRVFADFIYSIVEKCDIVMNSKGDALRSFCYLSDSLKGILLVMLKGKAGEAYNLGNPDQEFSILEVAKASATLFPERNIQIKMNEAVASGGYLKSPLVRNLPEISKIKALGWAPSITLKDGFARTVKYIESETLAGN